MFLRKIEEKFKGSPTARLKKLFKDVDLDNDGMIGFREWMRIVELAGNAISADEAEFLFVFWDTHAGEREQSGAIIIELAISDLLGTEPNYGSYFQAGGAPGVKEPTKNNRSSVEGGIFGGGMYEAESTRDRRGAPPGRQPMAQQNIAPPPMAASPKKHVNN